MPVQDFRHHTMARHAASAVDARSPRLVGRLCGTVVAATTLAAVLAALVQASAAEAIGRSARGDAVAAVALAMAREMMVSRGIERIERTPAFGWMPEDAVPAAAFDASRLESRRLGPGRLDLPPPAAA
jgi:hypothetical protein